MSDASRQANDTHESGKLSATAASAGHGWGDPIDDARMAYLDTKMEQQLAWVASATASERDVNQSAFMWAHLTGADIFYLAARASVGPTGEVSAALRYLRVARDYEALDPELDLSALHLEGANLEQADLEWAVLAGIHLDHAVLEGAHLNYAILSSVTMNGAILIDSHLEHANLESAHLKSARANFAHMEGTDLSYAHLEGADLSWANLNGARLENVHLQGAVLEGARIEGGDLTTAHLAGASFNRAHLERSDLQSLHLERVEMNGAHLEGADLHGARLEGANLSEAHLEGADLGEAHLEGAYLCGAFLDTASNLKAATFNSPSKGSICVADTRWGGVNLATVDGLLDLTLGDEANARTWTSTPASAERGTPGETLDDYWVHQRPQIANRLRRFRAAVRANRQLAVALQEHGMSEEAAHFAYRARLCQRIVLRLQRQWGPWIFSGFLDALVGYGYRPGRTASWYLAVVFGFAVGYWALGPAGGHTFAPDGALVFSVTSFHGRGFFPGGLDLENWITRLAALEAVIGLLIEISFIATFTQRYFGAR